MADLRIVDAPEIPTNSITGGEKIPTGGSGNYSITLDSLADYTKTKKDLADNTTVDNKVNGVRQQLNTHAQNLSNPHQVTKGQIGLGNVNNTADLDKPVSDSTQAAIISAVTPKANKTYVDSQDSLLQSQVDQKAETTYVDTAISNLSTVASKFYPTLAEANADISNIIVNQVVNIGEVANGGLWYKATSGSTTLTKSAYDSLTQAKNYVDAIPVFKQQKIVAGGDFNNITKQGVYYHWGANLTAAQVLNAPLYVSGNLAFGVLVVYNPDPNGGKNPGCTQTFYPYADGYAPFFRKVSQATGDFPTWGGIVTRATQHTYIEPVTTGQDVLTLTVGRYNIPSTTIGNSLLNMPTMTYKFGRIEVDYNATTGYKSIKIIPYGRDKNYYENRQYESGVWSGWSTFKDYETFKAENELLYAKITTFTAALAALANNITQDVYPGQQFTVAELTGTNTYSLAYYAGYNGLTTLATTFNTLKASIWNPGGGNVEYRIFTGTKTTSTPNGYVVSIANQTSPDFQGICKSFPTSNSGSAQDIVLDKAISIPANTPYVIVFRDTDLTTFGIRHFGAVSGSLESRGFNLSASATDWGSATIGAGTVPAYTQAGFQLLLKLPNSGGGTPQPTFTPELILPPKIYAVEGLQSSVYLEHTIVLDHTIYDYDFTCSKGIHQVRGWRWTPNSNDVAGNYNLTLDCLDKRTGDLLTTASTQVVLVNKNANSGVNKKVQVIGDSLVAAGSITQGLLNNASTDVMPVTLIGTLGTGLNKHEGRGGWTINDYTTVGRTYYLFTVSGVTTAPAINSTVYTYNGGVFTVQEANIASGNGTLLCSYAGTAPTNGTTGTLTKSNASAGDATIAFSNVQSQSGNPFWNGTVIDYQNYLTVNSLSIPDVVIIQLGINDTFSMTSDQAIIDLCATAFPKLDVLINSILAVNANVKVAVSAPPSYASQDAFGNNYQCGQTSRRAKRNITTYNKKLFAYYKNKEASRIFVLSGGINVDAENNFPESAVVVNSRNTKTVIKQTNAVHPDVSGYYQESDVFTAFIKSLT